LARKCAWRNSKIVTSQTQVSKNIYSIIFVLGKFKFQGLSQGRALPNASSECLMKFGPHFHSKWSSPFCRVSCWRVQTTIIYQAWYFLPEFAISLSLSYLRSSSSKHTHTQPVTHAHTLSLSFFLTRRLSDTHTHSCTRKKFKEKRAHLGNR